jgi:hypothetical protein
VTIAEQLSEAGLDIAHVFDAHAVATEFGWLAGRERRGILIGNTRALWPKLLEAMRDPEFAGEPDPVDRYVTAAIDRIAPGARVYYSHRRYASERGDVFLPFQQLAVATGLGALSEGGLVIHPIYGPWLALRAVLVVDGEPVARAPIAKPCVCDARCGASLQTALASTGDWRAWLAVRDSCALAGFRYSDAQIRYHYTKAWELEWGAPAPIVDADRAPNE